MISENYVFLGSALLVLGGLSYLIDTLRGKAKPNRVSFSLWSFSALLAFAAQVNKGVGVQSFLTLAAGIIPLFILLASFLNKKAEWKITKFDITCGVLSLLGLILWLITNEGTLALIFAILADILASFPTIIKSFNFPETENVWAYLTATLSGGITLLTIDNWNFATYSFSVNIFLISLIIYTFVQFKLKKLLKL